MENNKAMYQQERPATLGHKIRVKIRQLIAIASRYFFDKYSWSIRLFRESFVHHVKCFAVFWKLPNAIHGTEQLLFAETLAHKDTKDALATAEGRVENLIDKCIDELPLDATGEKISVEAIKSFYERLEMQVPEKYLTNEEVWDRIEDAHDSYLCSGGIADDAHITHALYEGRKLLGVKSEMVLQHPNEAPKYQYYKEVLSIKNGGWNISRGYLKASILGGDRNDY